MLMDASALAGVSRHVRAFGDGYRFGVVPTTVDPLDFVRAAAPVFGSARFLRTAAGVAIGTVGVAWRAKAAGVNRFPTLGAQWAAAPVMPPEARLLVGFSFSPDGPHGEEWDGFPAAEVVLPSLAVISDADGRRLVVAVPPGAEPGGLVAALRALPEPGRPRAPGFGDHWVHSVPPGTEWCAAVEEAVAAIASGSLRKVVLARSVEVRTETSIDPFETTAQLGALNPECHLFGWQIGQRAFVGASPELLIGRRGAMIRANPLAGSARRGDGDEEDRAVGEALMSSTKDRQEHALVVDDIAARLRPVTEDLAVPAAPSLRRIATVQHLSTEITGRLANGRSLFDLAGVLHPTPAVGGTPRAEAVRFIEKMEGIDRGWYSGGVGWLSPDGDGDMVIGLRCALISGSVARLYAGNGIVADSDPEAELVETRWKFRPVLSLLTVS